MTRAYGSFFSQARRDIKDQMQAFRLSGEDFLNVTCRIRHPVSCPFVRRACRCAAGMEAAGQYPVAVGNDSGRFSAH